VKIPSYAYLRAIKIEMRRIFGRTALYSLSRPCFKGDTTHGLKRASPAVSRGPPEEMGGSSAVKQPHLDPCYERPRVASNSSANCTQPNSSNSVNLWPPFSIAITPTIATPTYQ